MDKMNDIEAQVESLAKGIARRTGGQRKSLFACFFIVVNEEAATAGDVCSNIVGEGNVFRSGDPGTGSEDFRLWRKSARLLFDRWKRRNGSPLHNPNYDFNDDALVYGGSCSGNREGIACRSRMKREEKMFEAEVGFIELSALL